MEDPTSSQTSVLKCASSTSVHDVVFRCEYLFYYSSEMSDNDGTFSLALGICPDEFLFTKNNQMVRAEKKGFCALLKLVYFKTQLLELVESSMEVPNFKVK